MAKKKSWKEKFDETNERGTVKKQTDKGFMYISCPEEIEKVIRKVPKGKLITTKEIVGKLTKKHGVDFTCPLTTGIFVSIVANKAEEEIDEGAKLSEVTQYWRVIKPDGQIYDKYLGTLSKQDQYLEDEGYKIIPSKAKTKQPTVKGFEEFLAG